MVDLNTIRSMTAVLHPARTMPFDVLYQGLQARVNSGHINVQNHPTFPLKIYNYSHSCAYDGAWDKFTIIARGLILDPVNRKVIATPLVKFFNFGELSYEVPEGSFSTTMKYDGSLGIIFHYEGQWHVATRGSFISEQAQWATNWLRQNIRTEVLIPGCTYLAEIIYKTNRIVVSYDFEGLVLLTSYDEWGDEAIPTYLGMEAQAAGFRMVDYVTFNSIDEILKTVEGLSHDKEGFVICFDDGFRLKIKGSEYCRIHRIVSRITPLGIWEALVNCDNLDEISKIIPEEFRRDLETLQKILQEKYDRQYQELMHAVEQTKHLSDKDLGITLSTLPVSPEIRSFIFPCRKKGFLDNVKVPGKDRERFFEVFRPTGNKLNGYLPTTILNRFSSESE